MNIIRVLNYALEREKEGKRYFESNADRLINPSAARAFRAIADEEQRHIDYILAELKKLGEEVPADAVDPQLPAAGFFADRAEAEFIDQAMAESMVADLPVLRLAYLIERDFAEFYRNSAAAAEGEEKKTLEMLAKWESGHEKLFKKLHDDLFAKYADMPWGG